MYSRNSYLRLTTKSGHRDVHHRIQKRFRIPKLLIALVLLVGAGLFGWHNAGRRQAGLGSRSAAFSDASVRRPLNLPVLPTRPVYPYSIIPGGARTVAELKSAIANDLTVAAHYSEFRLDKARVIKLDRDLTAHVSFRRANRVYWTKKQLRIAKGETVITDGVRMARTRCGNQIAENLPPLAMLSPREPSPVQLDEPVPPEVFKAFPSDVIARAIEPVNDPGDPDLPLPPAPVSPANPLPPGSTTPIPFIPFPVLPPNTPPNSPPVRLPEPGTLELLVITLPVLWGFKRRTQNAKTQ